MRNRLTRVPKSAEGLVATAVRTIFQQPSAAEVHAQHARVAEQLESRYPEAAAMLAEADAEILAFTSFPVAHWRQIWSNNPQERLNREIRRRTDVVGIFPTGPRSSGSSALCSRSSIPAEEAVDPSFHLAIHRRFWRSEPLADAAGTRA